MAALVLLTTGYRLSSAFRSIEKSREQKAFPEREADIISGAPSRSATFSNTLLR